MSDALSDALKLVELELSLRAMWVTRVPANADQIRCLTYAEGGGSVWDFAVASDTCLRVGGFVLPDGDTKLDLGGKHAVLHVRYDEGNALQALSSPLLLERPGVAEHLRVVLDIDASDNRLRLPYRILEDGSRQISACIGGALFVPKSCEISGVADGRRRVDMTFFSSHKAGQGYLRTLQELLGVKRPEPDWAPTVLRVTESHFSSTAPTD